MKNIYLSKIQFVDKRLIAIILFGFLYLSPFVLNGLTLPTQPVLSSDSDHVNDTEIIPPQTTERGGEVQSAESSGEVQTSPVPPPDVQATLIRTPTVIKNGRAAVILANIIGDFSSATLNVTTRVTRDTNYTVPIIGGKPPGFPHTDVDKSQLPLVPISANWYITTIPGYPAVTIPIPLTSTTVWINSSVEYWLKVDGVVKASGNYDVIEDNRLDINPIVWACVYDVIENPDLLSETYGLSPSGWARNHTQTQEVLVTAIDDGGLTQDDIKLEYSVSDGAWEELILTQDPLMDAVNALIDGIRTIIDGINDLIELLPGLGRPLPEIDVSIYILKGEIPAQNVGNWVKFQANATDLDTNSVVSPTGFYYIKNGTSEKRVMIVDPHVPLWLLQENVISLVSQVSEYIDYSFPAELTNNRTLISELGDVMDRFSPEPFHHWELLGKNYNINITRPDENMASLLLNRSDGGFEPHAIVLSDLWLGLNSSGFGDGFTWDLSEIEIDGNGTLFEILRNYIKNRNAGLIATHGTLSDWKIWAGESEEEQITIGSRGHVGDEISDFDVDNETTVAAMLGMPHLALWEYLRDQLASALQSSNPWGNIVGSIPLQIPNIPFNGTLLLRNEGVDPALIEGLSNSFSIFCPSLYEEFGFGSYTEVGWQLALPQAFAYAAWDNANNTKDTVTNYVTSIAEFLGNVTNGAVSVENVTRILEALDWGLDSMYAAVNLANISTFHFNMTVSIPGYPTPIPIDFTIDLRQLLHLIPTKLVASSSNALAGIIAYDKYWDENGYRSVYFSLELEASNSTSLAMVEQLMNNAVEWTTDWSLLDITEFLGSLVIVSNDTADAFNGLVDALYGEIAYQNGTLFNEQGFAIYNVTLAEGTLVNLAIAHPTCAKVNITVLEGDAEVFVLVDGEDNVTIATVVALSEGTIVIGVQADPGNSSLNPSYVIIKSDSAPPTWDGTPTHQFIEYNGGLYYDLNASDSSGIDSWWINNTIIFSIDEGGIITNITPLSIGVYWLQVSVNDTYGNVQTATFKVTIQDTTPPSWDQIPTNQVTLGESVFQYDVNASDLSGIAFYWINDTSNFAINSNGLITNATSLVAGTYWIEVRAYDPYGYYCTATISITVQDTDDPSWDEVPANQISEYGTNFTYDVNATDTSGIDHYWVNDTSHFAINGDGLITNSTSLGVGVYWLEVRAYDPYGHYCTATFKVTVQDTTAPTWNPNPTDQLVEYCTGLIYEVNAFDLSDISSYWINDTVTFSIDANGLITNVTSLPVGIYWLEVRAYDPYSLYCTATFKVTVQDTTAPTWLQTPTHQVIEYGNELCYDVNATDHSGIYLYWINDTTSFAIDSSGIITNATVLPVGVKWLQIMACDPYGYFCFAEIKITVVVTTTPSTFGGTNDDTGASVIECSDGGFVIIGVTESFGAGGKDVWLIRLDSSGNHLWNKTFGGINDDYGQELVECSGGGFALIGITYSFGAGTRDLWLIRTDASGNHLWNVTFGGASWDEGYDLVECSGGGFAIVGRTQSFGAGGFDVWLVRTDASGNHLWNETYGNTGADEGYALVECSGGGFVLTGLTTSYGAGNKDVWLIRTDASGNHLWNKTFGGVSVDHGYDVIETNNGGFAIAGYTNNSGAGDLDVWLIRTSSSGAHLWNRTFGGTGIERGQGGLVECSDGGFAIAGWTYSFGAGDMDAWLLRTDSSGNLMYDETFGDTGTDGAYGIVECSNGGYALVGKTNSYGTGDFDVWFVRVSGVLLTEFPTDQVCELGASFHYDLNATSPVGIAYWWINDTTNFAISGTGIITDAASLSVGYYGLEIRAYDSYGYFCKTTFSLQVEDTAPPSWLLTPTNQIVEYGDDLSYDVGAFDHSGISSYWINDTARFNIDGAGLIINIVDLPVGIYWLEIRAYDPYGLYCTAVFHVTVQDTTPPVWATAPENQVLSAGESLDYQLSATDLSGIDRWTISDTTHFSISGTGRITSVVSLSPGTYPIQVTAYDPYDNPLSASFTVTVRSATTTTTTTTEPPAPPGGIPGFPVESVILGAFAALSLGVLTRRRQRRRKKH